MVGRKEDFSVVNTNLLLTSTCYLMANSKSFRTISFRGVTVQLVFLVIKYHCLQTGITLSSF